MIVSKPRIRTQAEVDRLIEIAIEEAVRYEEMRDAQEYESREYWHYHDLAIGFHWIAESFMPKSARTIQIDGDYRTGEQK